MTLRNSRPGPSLLQCLFVPLAAAFTSMAAAQSGDRAVQPTTKLDLLLVVDNSNSMLGEQDALRRQIPALLDALATGERYPGDPSPFRPFTDMHVGVVSTDMGIPGVDLPPSCRADGGDDGRLLFEPHPQPDLTCNDSYPQYQTYHVSDFSRERISNAVACTSSLGTGGCGFEQPLEAAFKALASSTGSYRFISITEPGTWGRGDVPQAEGGNLGFLRNDPEDPSLVAVLILTDEEDCSVKATDHLKPNNQLPEDSPFRAQDINLRCFYNKDRTYDLTSRYLDGLRGLRPDREDLVFFSVIAGVPSDLVDDGALAQTNFASEFSRERFYANILNDERMQEQIDPATQPGSGQGNLRPSCSRLREGEAPSVAYPPRRLVELARSFGTQGMVQSICQDDLQPAIAAIVDRLADNR